MLSQETHLFVRRHIDQILLCAVYGVCKTLNGKVGDSAPIKSSTTISFNGIIETYYKTILQIEPHSSHFNDVKYPDGKSQPDLT